MKLTSFLSIIKFKFFKSNLIVFIVFSVIWTLLAERLPARIYNYKTWLYRERKWEHGGKFYERIFLVKRWKSYLPDISDFLKWRFSKKHIHDIEFNYIQRFLSESCKSEFTHWMIICSSFLFILWGGIFTCLKIFVLATALNLPYIIIQRYNRPRLIRLLHKNSCQHYELSPVKA